MVQAVLPTTTNSKLFKAIPLFFSKTIQGLSQFSKIEGRFKAGLEFKAGAGTLGIVSQI